MKIIYALSLMMYASLSILAMDQQDIMTTQVPNDVLRHIGEYVADTNVKDIFKLAMVNKWLHSVLTKDVLIKELRFDRLIRAMPYDKSKDERQFSCHIKYDPVQSEGPGVGPFNLERHIKKSCSDDHYPGTVCISIKSVLNYSIYKGQHSLTKFLLEAGEQYDNQSLLAAIATDNEGAVKLLLEYGANPDEHHIQPCPYRGIARLIIFTPIDLSYANTGIHTNYPGWPTQKKADIYNLLRDAHFANLKKQISTYRMYILAAVVAG